MIYISKKIDPNYYPELEEGIKLPEFLEILKEHGHPNLTMEQLEHELFGLEKLGLVDLEVGEMP
jgi:hypothetical protein